MPGTNARCFFEWPLRESFLQQTQTYNTLTAARRKGLREWAEWVKGDGSYRIPVMEYLSHGDERHGTGNTANDILTGLYGDRWCDTCGEHGITYREFEPLRCYT